MARKRKRRTPEELAELREADRRADENLRRLRELIDRGWAELRRGEARAPDAPRG